MIPHGINLFIDKAISEGLTNDPDAFMFGSLKGAEAIKAYYMYKLMIPIPQAKKIQPRLYEDFLSQLREGIYDGQSIDSLIKSKSSDLSEMRFIYFLVISKNENERILSCDKTRCLPKFTRCALSSLSHTRERVIINYVSAYEKVNSEERPTSRMEIRDFLLNGSQCLEEDLDVIIQYMVTKEYI